MSEADRVDPVADINAAEIKEKLDAVLKSNARIEGRLEAIQSTLDSLTEKGLNVRGEGHMALPT